MQQLTLDVRPRLEPTLDGFVTGDNQALLAALRQQAGAQDGSWLYLWGAPASGRSHLLQATVREACRPARYLSADRAGELQITAGALVAVDDVEQLDEAGQAALFRALIQAREAQGSLILAGNAPPQHLRIREDVRTRIGQALIFEVQPLDDTAKGLLLMQHAAARGFMLEADIVEYLLRHGRRDARWLMAVLDALDEASLTQARPVTLPLLREILREDCEPELPF
ncbi:MAG: DnaA regulatory inactivator Hda [Candidatus Dactylopiibacterium carminicum]|uniref:DnaA regulatory inactivator Hda n=1 Tax=Candidatus Dactylopiibacterium carminicum TaxID=857335 RepID=A0A272ENH3_9RHOO|nr:DnaA regulatory inactivator Hda [Candidatus Dactylopiibacterium carminicum]KAF7599256.1 DnaA regulatory inactivator Hda [Candidatus Dactylopiibacterium carminicum]PAS91649.1 MAG: DnaA regulatory inactivator Hda [Candidatus Dactylopiibacterium carminicum]PAS97193.1 MAG: DnaA regulatory inactivator Hda [Candidatus Dactylopiibacterium carminicum]PAS99262.1 MAG: DnaA regulatory inactivator Hda [Candidatus Dactylopiibacterium carminicum]